MDEWLEQNGWWLFPLIGLVAWVTIRVRLRGGDESLWLRIIYSLQSNLDPRRKKPPLASRPAYAVWFLIVLFIIATMMTVARLNDS